MNYDHGADYCSLAFSFSEHQMCLFESMAGKRISIEEAIDRAIGSTAYAKAKAGKNRKVGCLIQDCTRIPIDRLAEVCSKLVDAGVYEFAYIYNPVPIVGATGSIGHPTAMW